MAGPRGKPRAAASAPAAKVEQQVFSTGLADEQFGATFGLLNGRIAIALMMLAVIAAASVLTAAVEIQGAVSSADVHQQEHQQQQMQQQMHQQQIQMQQQQMQQQQQQASVTAAASEMLLQLRMNQTGGGVPSDPPPGEKEFPGAHHRGMQQGEQISPAECVAGVAAIQEACCPGGGDGSGDGHRRQLAEEGGCNLPAACPEECAEDFLAYAIACPQVVEQLPGAPDFTDKCRATVGNRTNGGGGGNSSPTSPPPPLIAPIRPLNQLISDGPCADSTTWISSQGHTQCSQYSRVNESTPGTTSWYPMCNADRGYEHSSATTSTACEQRMGGDGCEEAAFMFLATPTLMTAAVACPVSCGTCPRCDDSIMNGGETGIDCGGPCPACRSIDCPAFNASGLLPANMDAVCTGQSKGSVYTLAAHSGYQTLTCLADLPDRCASDR